MVDQLIWSVEGVPVEQQSRRERLVLFGVIPVAAAVAGSIATVVIGKLTGGNPDPSQVVLAIVKDHSLNFEQKRQLIMLANDSTTKFYTWLSSVGMLFIFAISFFGPTIGPAIADRIRAK